MGARGKQGGEREVRGSKRGARGSEREQGGVRGSERGASCV